MNQYLANAFVDEMEKIAGVGFPLIPAVGGVYGYRKGSKKGKKAEGALRGAGGASAGALAGAYASKHTLLKNLKGLSNRNPTLVPRLLAALALSTAGGIAGYKALTSDLGTQNSSKRKVANAFNDELEKLSSKKKKLLGVGAGLGALGVGGLILSRGRSVRRASSAIEKATKGAKNLKPKIEKQTQGIRAGNQKADKLLREAKAERAHTDSMLSSLKDR